MVVEILLQVSAFNMDRDVELDLDQCGYQSPRI